MGHIAEHVASRMSAATVRPMAFVLALSIIIVWGVTGPLFGWSEP